MSGQLKALILQHEEPTPPGYLGEWLDGQGAEITVHRIDLAPDVDVDPREYDMIASLGSEYAAFDDTKAFIPSESRLMRRAVEADVPVLGLCFGGQLLARVMGGESFRHTRSEIGWLPVRTKDPELVDEGPWFQWHFDSFTVPPGGTLIADSDVGPQAYTLGRSLGLQFHPEVTVEIMESWVKAYRHELDGDGVDPDKLLEETHRLAPDVRRRSDRLFNRFLTRVARLTSEGVRGS
ncbi:MAG TPA: type 1 glutamine amidotransferase [Gaiellales bacterium]|nr:type 1 glutamine amidotransferase [Gaiellales bacterium]